MKVCVVPTGLHSTAMVRVANALTAFAPKGVEIVDDPGDADLQVLHVIGLDGLSELKAKDYAVIQYCGYVYRDRPELTELWRHARLTWSYYPLQDVMPDRSLFYLAPLGLDPAFAAAVRHREVVREIDLMTSGYVTGTAAEAIEEVALAVDALGQKMVHLGPPTIENMTTYPACWQTQHGINDATLAQLYLRTRRVSGLRHIEGFELPCVEGAACGARPVVFDRVDTRLWYAGLAEFVSECEGPELVDRLKSLFAAPPATLSDADRRAVRARFNWQEIVEGFWKGLQSRAPSSVSVSVARDSAHRRLLLVGDACVSTGFAEATHRTIEGLDYRFGGPFEVSVLGINYRGDPHPYPYDVWPTPSGDAFGSTRVAELIEKLSPAVVVIQQDPWNFPAYLRFIGVPTVGAVAVDGKNCRGSDLNGLDLAIFWTKFGEEQAKLGGYTGPSTVIPLGIDLDVYSPVEDRSDTRDRMGLYRVLRQRGLPLDSFIVGVVGRNQVRKRLDLTIEYFAEWVHSRKVVDAALWLHVAPTGDDAFDLTALGKFYGISDRLMIPSVGAIHGVTKPMMRRVYALFDVLLTTTVGEGWWLPGMEAMACGTPVLAPDYAAVGEWAKGAALLVLCTASHCHPPRGISSIGGVMDKVACVEALDSLYRGNLERESCRERGLKLAQLPEYRWPSIAERFRDAVLGVLSRQTVDVPTMELAAR